MQPAIIVGCCTCAVHRTLQVKAENNNRAQLTYYLVMDENKNTFHLQNIAAWTSNCYGRFFPVYFGTMTGTLIEIRIHTYTYTRKHVCRMYVCAFLRLSVSPHSALTQIFDLILLFAFAVAARTSMTIEIIGWFIGSWWVIQEPLSA